MLPLANGSDSRRRPVQITADPRVYRGSVFANRRIAHDNAKAAAKEDKKEKRYRVGVIREQLSSLLPRVPQTSNRLYQQQHRSGASSSKSRSFLPDLSTASSAAARNVSIDKKSFATARFLPMRNSAQYPKPTITENLTIGSATPLPKTKTTVEAAGQTTHFPVKVVVNFERSVPPDSQKTRILTSSRRGKPNPFSATATPPSSSRQVFPIVDSYVQTDDNFDEKFDDLVKELSSSAINMAMFQLEGEDELERMRKNGETLKIELNEMTKREFEQKEKWQKEILQKTAELETWKKQELNAREAQKLALETCQEVTRKTLENIKIIEQNSKRSIGLDTREMNKLERKMNLVTAELEKDFFPWLFQRAERMFRNRLIRNQLDDSTLNELQHRREAAKKRLINMNSTLV